ncbi:MAG: DUF2278 family protein [Vicinamibacteraceae bacterium]
MPLRDGYGVLIGTIHRYFRDDTDDFGRYYHANLIVAARPGHYRCALDGDSKQSSVGMEWRTVLLGPNDLEETISLGPGYHPLTSRSDSGALDYMRSRMLATCNGCSPDDTAAAWKRGTGQQALEDLEPLVQITQAGNLAVLIYGEPFATGLGMHNIHQNQGDPPGSPWTAENGIWQDGCTILQQTTDTYVAFMNKFSSQSYRTDDDGRPV